MIQSKTNPGIQVLSKISQAGLQVAKGDITSTLKHFAGDIFAKMFSVAKVAGNSKQRPRIHAEILLQPAKHSGGKTASLTRSHLDSTLSSRPAVKTVVHPGRMLKHFVEFTGLTGQPGSESRINPGDSVFHQVKNDRQSKVLYPAIITRSTKIRFINSSNISHQPGIPELSDHRFSIVTGNRPSADNTSVRSVTSGMNGIKSVAKSNRNNLSPGLVVNNKTSQQNAPAEQSLMPGKQSNERQPVTGFKPTLTTEAGNRVGSESPAPRQATSGAVVGQKAPSTQATNPPQPSPVNAGSRVQIHVDNPRIAVDQAPTPKIQVSPAPAAPISTGESAGTNPRVTVALTNQKAAISDELSPYKPNPGPVTVLHTNKKATVSDEFSTYKPNPGPTDNTGQQRATKVSTKWNVKPEERPAQSAKPAQEGLETTAKSQKPGDAALKSNLRNPDAASNPLPKNQPIPAEPGLAVKKLITTPQPHPHLVAEHIKTSEQKPVRQHGNQKNSNRSRMKNQTADTKSTRTEKPSEAKIAKPELHSFREAIQNTHDNLVHAAKNVAHKQQPEMSARNRLPMQNMNELVRSIQMNLRGGARELIFHLKPDFFGKAAIMFRQEKDSLVLEFTVENDNARHMIESETSRLREALTSSGFQQVTIEVKTSGDTPNRAGSADEENSRKPTDKEREESEKRENQAEQYLRNKPRMMGYNTFDLVA